MTHFRNALVSALAVVLSGCSTPNPALEQANHTTALMGGLETELQILRRVAGASAEARQESMREQKLAIVNAKLLSGPRIRARISAGDVATQMMVDRMLADTDAIAADEAAASSALAANDAEIEKIMTPLASTSALMTQAQAKMAVMGTELPARTRAVELFAFVKAVKENVDQNRKKIDEAAAEKLR